MKKYSNQKFIKLIKHNGFHFDRNGSNHIIYKRKPNEVIQIPHSGLEEPISQRYIKQYNLLNK